MCRRKRVGGKAATVHPSHIHPHHLPSHIHDGIKKKKRSIAIPRNGKTAATVKADLHPPDPPSRNHNHHRIASARTSRDFEEGRCLVAERLGGQQQDLDGVLKRLEVGSPVVVVAVVGARLALPQHRHHYDALVDQLFATVSQRIGNFHRRVCGPRMQQKGGGECVCE